MSFVKRQLEATEADVNSEMGLCALCDERGFEGFGRSWRHEQTAIGPYTTVWLCGDCLPPDLEPDELPTNCLACEVRETLDDAPLCQECLSAYDERIAEHYRDAECSRCGSSIPPSEWDEYGESGLCGWCAHMEARSREDDRRFESSADYAPGEPSDRRIITPEEFRRFGLDVPNDPRVIRYLDEHFDEVFALSPRQFEELIAELLKGFGYKVNLGPRGRDGGVDVYAERDLDCGPELVLVQCKHYRPDHKVGEPVVKQLYADVVNRRATRGMAVTTSSFTRTALDYIERLKYQMSGVDHSKLREWFRSLSIER